MRSKPQERGGANPRTEAENGLWLEGTGLQGGHLLPPASGVGDRGTDQAALLASLLLNTLQSQSSAGKVSAHVSSQQREAKTEFFGRKPRHVAGNLKPRGVHWRCEGSSKNGKKSRQSWSERVGTQRPGGAGGGSSAAGALPALPTSVCEGDPHPAAPPRGGSA